MQVKILGWEVGQIAELVDEVNKNNNKSMLKVFGDFATHNQRGIYSVRNFYYALIREAKNNNSVREILAKNNIKLGYTSHFNECEEREILKSLLIDNGKSVRATCFMLAKGEKSKAIRYQNKYRNSLKHKPDFVKKLAEEITASGDKCRLNLGGKILTIPNQVDRNYLTESEIQSLFLGLVRLVKRSAEQEMEERQNYQMRLDNSRLMEVALDNKRKAVLIRELKAQNQRLKNLLNNSQKLRKVGSLGNQNYKYSLNLKMDKLRDYVSKLSKNEQKTSKKR